MTRLIHRLRIRYDLARLILAGHVRRHHGGWYLTDRGRRHVDRML